MLHSTTSSLTPLVCLLDGVCSMVAVDGVAVSLTGGFCGMVLLRSIPNFLRSWNLHSFNLCGI